MNIRLEQKEDYLEVEKLVRNSFWNIYRPGAFEHFIVHNLREDESFIADLAYVIEKDGKIIGHNNDTSMEEGADVEGYYEENGDALKEKIKQFYLTLIV